MDHLDDKLKQFRKRVTGSDTEVFYDTILYKAMQPAMPLVPLHQLKRIAAAATVLVLLNASVIFWGLSKADAPPSPAPNNPYLQTFDLNLY